MPSAYFIDSYNQIFTQLHNLILGRPCMFDENTIVIVPRLNPRDCVNKKFVKFFSEDAFDQLHVDPDDGSTVQVDG